MELGALVCTPKAPRCGDCPISGKCQAFRQGKPERFPELSKRTASTARRFHAFVLQHNATVWVVQRPEGVVNGGFWEFPNVEVTVGTEVLPTTCAKAAWGIECRETKLLKVVRHSITRYRIELQAHLATVDARTRQRISAWADSNAIPHSKPKDATIAPSQWVRSTWVKPEEAGDKAFTAAHRRVLRAWLDNVERSASEKSSPNMGVQDF